MAREVQLAIDVEEFFNEEDTSVGLYAIGEIDEVVVKEFQDVFEDISVKSYTSNELIFEFDDETYNVELKQYHDDAKWVMHRLFIF